jgi:hypothetical protein
MSDRNKNMKTRFLDFLHYHRDEMTGKERNSFERELQKDLFAEEASEGFASKSSDELLRDIEHLQKLLKKRESKNRRVLLYGIAASIAVLLMISSVFVFIERGKPGVRIAENQTKSGPLEIAMNEPIILPPGKSGVPGNSDAKADKNMEKPAASNASKKPDERAKSIESLPAAEMAAGDQISENKNKEAEVSIVSEKTVPSVAALSNRKVISQRAAGSIAGLPSGTDTTASFSEEIVSGYALKRADETKDDTSERNIAPSPVNGKIAFNKYIRDNLIRPDTATTGQRVVVIIRFLVRSNGRIDSIRVEKSPGKLFSDEAIRLIRSGPAWEPAVNSGKATDQYVRLKIVFK